MTQLGVDAVRELGGCGALNDQGNMVCILPKDHEPPHGWNREQTHPQARQDLLRLRLTLREMKYPQVGKDKAQTLEQMCEKCLDVIEQLIDTHEDLVSILSRHDTEEET